MVKQKEAAQREEYMLEDSEEGQSYRPPTAFLDVLLILFCVVLFGLVMNEQKKTSEYQVKIDMLKKELANKKPASMKPDPETPSLTMTAGNGREAFTITSVNQGTKSFQSLGEVRKYLELQRPAKLVIRAERTVPSGVLQETLLDCQELHILPFLSAASK